MEIKDILGLLFLIGIGVVLYRSFIAQQKEAGLPTAFNMRGNIPMIPVFLGLLFGGGIGMAMFWPTVFGQALSVPDVVELWGAGGDISHDLLDPWITKTVICALIGGAVGFVVPMVITSKTAQ